MYTQIPHFSIIFALLWHAHMVLSENRGPWNPLHTYTYMYIHVCNCMYIYIYIHIRIYIYIHISICIYMYVYIYIHIYIYVYIYTRILRLCICIFSYLDGDLGVPNFQTHLVFSIGVDPLGSMARVNSRPETCQATRPMRYPLVICYIAIENVHL